MSKSNQFKAMDNYFKSLLSDEMTTSMPYPLELQAENSVARYAELDVDTEKQTKLVSLLASVTNEDICPIVSESISTKQSKIHSVKEWENIKTENEFQALFFVVSGVMFAVPLTDLGGIHQIGKINTLFGRPDWFAGVMTQREYQLNVVDTTRWIMPGQVSDEQYQYLVMLGNSSWGLACHQLHGTELLSKDKVQWRTSAGKRPWLAGMVKDRMCALLHVTELLILLEKGVDIDGH